MSAPPPTSSSGMLLLRSPDRIGEDIRTSERRCEPGGMETTCLKDGGCLDKLLRVPRHQDARIIAAARCLHKCFHDGLPILCRFLDAVSVTHDIDRNIVLLELLRELHHRLLVCSLAIERRGDENNDALAEVLVLTVLESKLGNGNGSRDVYLAADF